jgi:hypothetical protein
MCLSFLFVGILWVLLSKKPVLCAQSMSFVSSADNEAKRQQVAAQRAIAIDAV